LTGQTPPREDPPTGLQSQLARLDGARMQLPLLLALAGIKTWLLDLAEWG